MNDAPLPAADRPIQHGRDIDSREDVPTSGGAGSDLAPSETGRRVQRDHRLSLLKGLIRDVDIMVYCELSILYYMDCSLFRFFLRAFPQWFYFTPKPDIFPPTPLLQRPYVSTIFGSNALCLLLHILLRPPVAGEATHQYLHGGLVIDFVGQHSPSSRLRLLGLDLLTFFLQVLMLAISIEKQKIEGRTFNSSSEYGGNSRTQSEATRQDHDAEEQGILRSDRGVLDDIELQNLRPHSQGRTDGDEDRERDEFFVPRQDIETNVAHPLDFYYTGDHVLANLHILETVRMQWNLKGVGADSTAVSTASGVRTAATIAGRRIGMGFGERTAGVD